MNQIVQGIPLIRHDPVQLIGHSCWIIYDPKRGGDDLELISNEAGTDGLAEATAHVEDPVAVIQRERPFFYRDNRTERGWWPF